MKSFAPLGMLIGFWVALIAARAWVCDDAAITFRVVDNWLHGFGPRWNVVERVQVFSHPLWMLLLAAVTRLTSNLYWTSLGLGVLLSAAAAIGLAWGVATSVRAGAVALVLQCASVASLDYATAGMENALGHALLVCGMLAATRTGATVRTLGVAGCAGLLLVHRVDAVWLVGPAAVTALSRAPRSLRLQAFALLLLPVLLWAGFAFVYYGDWIPNSARAKLATGLPFGARATAGVAYLLESLRHDPVTLVATIAGIAAGWRRAVLRPWASGALLHLLGIVIAGGDFMSGRLLTPSFMVAVACLACGTWSRRAAWIACTAAAVAALLGPRAVWRPASAPEHLLRSALDARGIADERRLYERVSGWRHARRDVPWPDPAVATRARTYASTWLEDPMLTRCLQNGLVDSALAWPEEADAALAAGRTRPVILRAAIGFEGWYAGPAIHVVDVYGLGDPLLARLPALERDPLVPELALWLHELAWRPGHFVRRIPAGYLETLIAGTNQVRDPDLALRTEPVILATRAPLLDARRWRMLLTRGPAS
jgi:arabinofuranosyltransferase